VLTPRERAAGAYQNVAAQGRGLVLGADMADVTRERSTNVRTAQRVLEAARGTERYSIREPDDASLEAMLTEVRKLADTLAADSARWATGGPGVVPAISCGAAPGRR